MKELIKNKNKPSALYSLPVLILMLFLSVLLIKASWGVLEKERSSAKKLEELEVRTQELKARQDELTRDLEYLETEEGLAEEIREKFSVVREGEFVAILVSPTENKLEVEEEEAPWYKRFWDAIMPPYDK